MKNFILKFLFTAFFIIFLGLPSLSYSAGADFSITLIPQNPSPGSEATAKVSSLHFDINRASITWIVDGKVVSKGLGRDTIGLNAPSLGKKRTVSASVTTSDGDFGAKSIAIAGNDLDLLWESMTTTPFNYKGRSLPTVQSQVKVTAIPYLFKNGLLSSSNLIYEWSLNFKKDINASGAGKNYFIFQAKDRDDYTVSLKVSNRGNDVVFEKGVTIPAGNIKPKILLYKDHPLEGPLYGEALKGSVNIGDNEISIRAEPFFFSKNNISFNWEMNNKSIFPDEAPNILKLKAPENGRGETSIGLDVRNNFNVLQFANTALKVIFGNN